MGVPMSEWSGAGAPANLHDPAIPDLAASEGGALAHSMVERIIRSGPTSHAEALKSLRMAFPDSPLTVRVAALAILMRRSATAHLST